MIAHDLDVQLRAIGSLGHHRFHISGHDRFAFNDVVGQYFSLYAKSQPSG
jgi:hypothetical protein